MGCSILCERGEFGGPIEGLCWLCENAIEGQKGRVIPRSRQCMVCTGTGYTGRKFGDFLGLSKLERCDGCIEGL